MEGYEDILEADIYHSARPDGGRMQDAELAPILQYHVPRQGRRWTYGEADIRGATTPQVLEFLREFVDANGAFIAHMKGGGGHFVLVTGVVGNRVEISNPARTTPTTIPIETFQAAWSTGVVFSIAN